MELRFPEGRRFAFTIMDDTDVATVANVEPMYRLLETLGLRTTKTVWSVGCPEGSADFGESQTLEDLPYLDFVRDLAARGFEIAYHGATMESSRRERTSLALARYIDVFGGPPEVYANHAYNRENLYWGIARVDHPVIRMVYSRMQRRPADHYQGDHEGSPWWWGDLAQKIRYVRNLTFSEINLLRVNPSMPYHDPRRPLVRFWFSASDAEDVSAFNRLLAVPRQERLERQGGVCIVATHLGKGFVRRGEVDPDTRRLLERLAGRPGWFVPVGELLDWLQAHRNGEEGLPAAEWQGMQWRWLRDLILRQVRWRLLG